MSKIIQSPVKRWPGSVTLSDPLTIPQTMAYEDAVKAARENAKERGEVLMVKDADGNDDERTSCLFTHTSYDLLPGVCACVETWELTGLPAQITPETFPGSPRIASAQLLGWLIGEISKLYSEAESLPNG